MPHNTTAHHDKKTKQNKQTNKQTNRIVHHNTSSHSTTQRRKTQHSTTQTTPYVGHVIINGLLTVCATVAWRRRRFLHTHKNLYTKRRRRFLHTHKNLYTPYKAPEAVSAHTQECRNRLRRQATVRLPVIRIQVIRKPGIDECCTRRCESLECNPPHHVRCAAMCTIDRQCRYDICSVVCSNGWITFATSEQPLRATHARFARSFLPSFVPSFLPSFLHAFIH